MSEFVHSHEVVRNTYWSWKINNKEWIDTATTDIHIVLKCDISF